MRVPALRVAIDGRTLQARPLGGVGRTLASLLPHLAEQAQVDVLLDSRRASPRSTKGLVVHCLRAPLSSRDATWLQLAAPRWLRGYEGLFHCPFYGLPYRQPVPMVATIHDLTFEFAPSWFSAANRIVFRRQARWAARTARRILTDSEHVRSMVLERYARYGLTPERVSVARLPVDPGFAPDPPGLTERLARLNLDRPYVVTLGGAPRRQLSVAVAAWERACEQVGADPREMPLVVVGSEAPALRDGVLALGVLSDEDLVAVIAGARAFCYATLYEGYGMPALEAAASGTPIVCARVGSLPEVLGGAAAWSEAPDAESLGAALAGLLIDDLRAEALATDGLARVRALPSPAEAAAVIVSAYHEALLA